MAQDLLNESGRLRCRQASTPSDQNKKLGKCEEGAPVNREQLQRLIDWLHYINHTPPDAAFAVNLFSQFIPQGRALKGSLQSLNLTKANSSTRALVQARWRSVSGDLY